MSPNPISSRRSSTHPPPVGEAIQQTTTSFTTANVKASGVFRSNGVDASLTPSVDFVQIGQANFDGAGNFSGVLDSNDGGSVDTSNGSTNGVPNPQVLSGLTYSVSSLGYLTLANGGSHTPNFYLYAPGAGFGIDSKNTIDLFTLSPQTIPSGGYTTANLNSTYLAGSYALGTTPPQAYSSSGNYPGVFDAAVAISATDLTGYADEVSALGVPANLSVDQSFTNTYALDTIAG